MHAHVSLVILHDFFLQGISFADRNWCREFRNYRFCVFACVRVLQCACAFLFVCCMLVCECICVLCVSVFSRDCLQGQGVHEVQDQSCPFEMSLRALE